MKDVVSKGINSTPYVPMKWEDSNEAVALFDTGSQWSLVQDDVLTGLERQKYRC